MSTIGFDQHDHGGCISDALAAAEAYCVENRLKLTPIRRRVLEILLSGHRAVGAYDILAVLREDGSAAQPPVAYRALDFLVKHGFAHRVERLNAFVACAHPGEAHNPAFLICQSCDAIAEATSPKSDPIEATALSAGFKVERRVIEAEGLCPKCQDPI